jgi:hypothetical protein
VVEEYDTSTTGRSRKGSRSSGGSKRTFDVDDDDCSAIARKVMVNLDLDLSRRCIRGVGSTRSSRGSRSSSSTTTSTSGSRSRGASSSDSKKSRGASSKSKRDGAPTSKKSSSKKNNDGTL